MTSKQVTVMWLGILLIAARLFTTKQWSAIWGTIGTESTTPTTPVTTPTTPVNNGCPGGSQLINGKCQSDQVKQLPTLNVNTTNAGASPDTNTVGIVAA
jgi:hypothetical protein